MASGREPSPSPLGGRGVLLIALLGIALAVGGWLAYQRLGGSPQGTPSGSPDAWPTIPATVTPLPTAPAATPIPTPAPLPTPAVKEIGELAVLSHTFEVVKDVTPSSEKAWWEGWKKAFPGEDRFIVRTAWKASYGMEGDTIKDFIVVAPTERTTITLYLPPLKLLHLEQVGAALPVLSTQQSVFSDYPGMETDALNQAHDEAESLAEDNQDMLNLATELTRLRLVEKLRGLGYTSVTINFDTPQRDS